MQGGWTDRPWNIENFFHDLFLGSSAVLVSFSCVGGGLKPTILEAIIVRSSGLFDSQPI